MAPTLIIRQDHPARRCEVCHQTDQFDPDTGLCTRCAGLSLANLSTHADSGTKKNPKFLYKNVDDCRMRDLMGLCFLILLFGGAAVLAFSSQYWITGACFVVWLIAVLFTYRQSIEEVVSPDGQNVEIKRYFSREFIETASIVRIRQFLWGYGGIELELKSGKIIALDLDRADQQKLIEGLRQINPELEIR
ncbi:MAG: hypothetical protein HY774_14470 [Acidobacteria bacterium]|nr:hypothetical protein [Acidobacteriota bacterium]